MKNHFLKSALMLTVASISMATIISCANQGKKGKKQVKSMNMVETQVDSIINMVYALPDPEEILDEILIDTMQLYSGLVNPIQKSKSYVVSTSIALNMGVYSADMAYLILQENNLKAIDYFRAIMQMSNSLNITTSAKKDLLEEIENNIGDRKKLLQIFKNSMNELKYTMEYSEQKKVLALMHTGAIIEALYLAVNNLDCDKPNGLITKIAEQKHVIANLQEFLHEFSADKDINSTIEDIDVLNNTLSKGESNATTVRVDKSNKLHISSPDNTVYSPEEIDTIKNTVIEIRNKIVGA